MLQVRTVADLGQAKTKLPIEIIKITLSIVDLLDRIYGVDREVDNDDGGFVLIVEDLSDLDIINVNYLNLESGSQEYAILIKCENTTYVNALFLCNNDFGINVIIPAELAPKVLLEGILD